MREIIEIAANIYRCQNTVKRFFRDEYNEKIEPYKQVVSGVASENGVDALKAVLKICEDDVISQNGWAVMMLMAAAAEIIEPSKERDDERGATRDDASSTDDDKQRKRINL